MQKRIDRLHAHSFDWVLLRSFLAIFRAGSMVAAARELALQQSTLSRHLSELERQLGVTLFERVGRGLKTTEAAKRVAEYAVEMEDCAQRLSQSLAARNLAMAGTVRIAASQLVATFLLPDVVAGLLREHPGLQLEIMATDAEPNVLQRDADIAVWHTRPTQLDLVARKLGTFTVVAAAHERYLAAHGTPRRLEDLREHLLIGMDRIDVVQKGVTAAGLPSERHDFRLRTDDKTTYLKAMEAGIGIGFVATFLVAATPGLRRVLPELAFSTSPCWLVTHREIGQTPLLRLVFDALAERIGQRLAQA